MKKRIIKKERPHSSTQLRNSVDTSIPTASMTNVLSPNTFSQKNPLTHLNQNSFNKLRSIFIDQSLPFHSKKNSELGIHITKDLCESISTKYEEKEYKKFKEVYDEAFLNKEQFKNFEPVIGREKTSSCDSKSKRFFYRKPIILDNNENKVKNKNIIVDKIFHYCDPLKEINNDIESKIRRVDSIKINHLDILRKMIVKNKNNTMVQTFDRKISNMAIETKAILSEAQKLK